jgi:hypothetical protein
MKMHVIYTYISITASSELKTENTLFVWHTEASIICLDLRL